MTRMCREPLARVIAQALPVFDIKFAFTLFFTFYINLLDTVIHRLNNCGLSIRLSYGNGPIGGKEKKVTRVGIESTTLGLDLHWSSQALG